MILKKMWWINSKLCMKFSKTNSNNFFPNKFIKIVNLQVIFQVFGKKDQTETSRTIDLNDINLNYDSLIIKFEFNKTPGIEIRIIRLDMKLENGDYKRIPINSDFYWLCKLENLTEQPPLPEFKEKYIKENPVEIFKAVSDLTDTNFDAKMLDEIDEIQDNSCRYDIQSICFQTMNSLYYDHFQSFYAVKENI
ncbi:MAG: hypothetical protein EU529_12045 [Promethearchaeota archaeon]|nr:MAG: hypothetical protein EU529_12045 [Candidatus Lokiarchaeota archaeon]